MLFLLANLAWAAPTPEDGIAVVEQLLTEHGGRLEDSDKHYCNAAQGPWGAGANRRVLCERVTPVRTMALRDLRATGGERVSARLGVYRFESGEAAEQAVALTLEGLPVQNIGTSWCFADAIWSDEVLWTLEYGCHISLRHVPALDAVSAGVHSWGVAVKGVAGIAGLHSGGQQFVDGERTRVDLPFAEVQHHFARVKDVEANDVLWVRADPYPAAGAELDASGFPKVTKGDPEKVGKLGYDASCVAVLGTTTGRRWWVVRDQERFGYAAGRYLELQTADECADSEAWTAPAWF